LLFSLWRDAFFFLLFSYQRVFIISFLCRMCMSLAIIYSRASSGITAPLVTVETHIARGLPTFLMVGLPEAAVKESRDRVRSALINSHFEFPRGRITVNLAPADLPKEGGRFDLPIALGILAATKQIPYQKLAEYEFTGELALSGEIRPIRGVLPVALGAKQSGRRLIVPKENAQEASLVKDAMIFSAQHLLEVCAYLKGERELDRCEFLDVDIAAHDNLDLADVKGQPFAKRSLEIAAAGRHSLLLMGPPGTGKTMLASRIPSILPPLSDKEGLEIASIASISHVGFCYKNWLALPFRAPHHTSSSVALVGGGRPPRPGEISLTHNGVLFLDELPEFNRHVLEALREPLESGQITISRAGSQAIFPANFQLIAAMNPCPCGFAGSPTGQCQCSYEQIKRYMAKLSGPLLDRVDMQVEVPALPPGILGNHKGSPAESSAVIRERVVGARTKQVQRQNKPNAMLLVPELEQFCELGDEASRLLDEVMVRFNLSARVYHRIIKVARTIADLEVSDPITVAHLSEALGYRCLDRSKLTY
jgi:magnesium chelatase family protein